MLGEPAAAVGGVGPCGKKTVATGFVFVGWTPWVTSGGGLSAQLWKERTANFTPFPPINILKDFKPFKQLHSHVLLT